MKSVPVGKKKKTSNIKREISKFMRGERGRISKHSLMLMGSILGSAAAAALLSAKDVSAGPVSITKTGSGANWNVVSSVTHGY